MGFLFVIGVGVLFLGLTVGDDNDDPAVDDTGEITDESETGMSGSGEDMLASISGDVSDPNETPVLDGGPNGADADDGDDGTPTLSQEDPAVTLSRLTNDDDTLISEDYRAEAEASIQALVDSGELTASEAADTLAAIDFRSGVINIDALRGNDAVVGSQGNDKLVLGADIDIVFGGEGDDTVRLGPGTDVTGIDERVATRNGESQPFPGDGGDLVGFTEAQLEGGNDTIDGRGGNDFIADGYGSNTLEGRSGNDFIVAVDQDGVTPDIVRGGNGEDVLFVDQGDTVNGGNGADQIIVEAPVTLGADYQPTVLNGFVKGTDDLTLDLDVPVGAATPVVTVEQTEDGADSTVLVDGVAAITVTGVPDLALADITVDTGNTLSQETEGFTEGDDTVVSGSLRPAIVERLDGSVGSGDLSQEQVDAALAETTFVPDPINGDALRGNDAVIGGTDDDTILAGDGRDAVQGGAGDDIVRLGDGADSYGDGALPTNAMRFAILAETTAADLEGGNDFVDGGGGADTIVDRYGENQVEGRNGNDTLNVRDADDDALTPDRALGGKGDDTILVDQGDDVNTGLGSDLVRVDLDLLDLSPDYLPTVIRDFDGSADALAMDITLTNGFDFLTPPPVITTTVLADGAGSAVQVNGQTVVQLLGVAELAEEDVTVLITTVLESLPVIAAE